MLWKTVSLAALASLALLAVHEVTASRALNAPGLIRITEREVQYTRVDIGRPGLSPGDLEITRAQLFNTRITSKSIGHAELVCTFTSGSQRNCTGTFSLPRGKIVVGGELLYRPLFQLAIVGGTNLYDNARGTLTVTLLGRIPRKNLLLFRLNV